MPAVLQELSPFISSYTELPPNLALTTAIFILLLNYNFFPVPFHSFGFEAFNSYHKINVCINYSLALNTVHLQKVNELFFLVEKMYTAGDCQNLPKILANNIVHLGELTL